MGCFGCFRRIVSLIVSKVLQCNSTIGKVGFLSLRELKISLRDGSFIFIDKIWVTSGFVNQDYRKPVVLCIGEIRLEVTSCLNKPQYQDATSLIPDKKLTEGPTQNSLPTQRSRSTGHSVLKRITTILQYASASVANVNVVIVDAVVPDCLVHISVEDLSFECFWDRESFQIEILSSSVSLKLLRRNTQSSGPPCILELSLRFKTNVYVDAKDYFNKATSLSIQLPKIYLRHELLEMLLEKGSSLLESRCNSAATSPSGSSTKNLSAFYPKKFELAIESCFGKYDLDLDRTEKRHTLLFESKLIFISVSNAGPLQCKFTASGTVIRNFYSTFFKLRDAQIFHEKSEKQRVLRIVVEDCMCRLYEEILCLSLDSNSLLFRVKELTRILNRPGLSKAPEDISLQSVSAIELSSICVFYISRIRSDPSLQCCLASFNLEMATEECITKCELSCEAVYCGLIVRDVATISDCSNYVYSVGKHDIGTVLYLEQSLSQIVVKSVSDHCDIEFQEDLLLVLASLNSVSSSFSQFMARDSARPIQKIAFPELDFSVTVTDFCASIPLMKTVCTACRADKLRVEINRKVIGFSVTGFCLLHFNLETGMKSFSNALLWTSDAVGIDMPYLKLLLDKQGKELSVHSQHQLRCCWSANFHFSLFHIVELLQQNLLQNTVSKETQNDIPSSGCSPNNKEEYTFVVVLEGDLHAHVLINDERRLLIKLSTLKARRSSLAKALHSRRVTVAFDGHDIFQFEDLFLKFLNSHADVVRARNEHIDELSLAGNRAVSLTMQKLSVTFPYSYDFSGAFDELLSLKKWLKSVHASKKMVYSAVGELLAPDLLLFISEFYLTIEDDPFEVKLRDNYVLLTDEFHECERREQILNTKIDDLRKATHNMLSREKIDELYESLSHRNGEIYVQRSKQMYAQQQQANRPLFTWSGSEIRVVAMADPLFHGKENVLNQILLMDPDSPPVFNYDNTAKALRDCEFVTLWCRYVELKFESMTMSFRDYPQPYFDLKQVYVVGKLAGSEMDGTVRAKRACAVSVGKPWGLQQVHKNMPPLKFYYDLCCESFSFSSAYGPCWEPCLAMLGICLDNINKPSIDPSPPLAVWDKIRLLFHGQFNVTSKQLTLIMLASSDPYNTTEQLELSWENLEFGWKNGMLVINGTADAYIRTASKYDEVRLFHLPSLKILVQMLWLCNGNPNDHHSVMPCSPDKVAEFSLNETHDSYAKFRSHNLNVSMSLEIKRQAEAIDSVQDSPEVQLYANTFRWLDTLKTTWSAVNRPIKRGKLFKCVMLRKPQLSRHYKQIRLNISLPEFIITYRMSVSSDCNGIRLSSESLQLCSVHILKPFDQQPHIANSSSRGDLVRRAQVVWEIGFMNAELSSVEIHLLSRCSPEGPLAEELLSFFMSLSRLSYNRDELASQRPRLEAASSELPSHHLVLYDLRGAWSLANRDALLSIWDGYQKSRLLKRNLSTDALKSLKVDEDVTPKKKSDILKKQMSSFLGKTSSLNSATSEVDLLLQQLISESSTKFIAYSEETAERPSRELQGVLLCETHDVLFKDWLIELINGQVVVRGCETGGYLLCTAASAKIVNNVHQPVFRDGQLLGKTTWFGAVTDMQYYATVRDTKLQCLAGLETEVKWLSKDLIEEQTQPRSRIDVVASPGDSAGGVVAGGEDGVGDPTSQLQRIISRCGCQFYFCHFDENIDPELSHVPVSLQLTTGDYALWSDRECVDCFTMKHTTLNCCTNHLQYSMILDMVNNLLLYVDPLKKQSAEKLQRLRFQLKLESLEDLRPRILPLQDQVRTITMLRQLLLGLRYCEKQLYFLEKQLKKQQQSPFADIDLTEEIKNRIAELESELCYYKSEVPAKADTLAMTISCYKEKLIQKDRMLAESKLSPEQQAQIARRFEVCFEEAQWRLTEIDGQIGLADMKITNFLYTKISRINNSGEHLLEVGYAKISNLLPNSPYKDVLQPQHLTGLVANDRNCAIRVLCREMPPVGGISIKEHFEVNVVPMTIQMTYAFFMAMMKYFFPDKNIDTEDRRNLDNDEFEPGAACDKPKVARSYSFRQFLKKKHCLPAEDEIDKMKKRAETNNVFLTIKVPEVPLLISYKGEKEKSIADVENFRLLFPTVEYHDQNWTWLDLALAIKQRSKRVLLQQFMMQKILKSSGGQSEVKNPSNLPEEEKAKLLLGAKLLSGTLQKPGKKT